MTQKHALVLSGALLPGFTAERTWPDLAARLRIDEQRLREDVLARAPVAIKESDDLARLEVLRDDVQAAGAEASIHALDEDGSVFALIDNIARGPLPRRFVADRVQRGLWPASVRVAAVGSRDWIAFDAAPSPVAAPPPPPIHAAAPMSPADGALLPPGEAIHAGYWRRSAAYLIDQMILFIPSMVVGIVPLLGILAIFTGQWLYFALMESSPAQATLGKQAMGIKATDNRGRRLSFGHASGRHFAGALSVFTFYIGYMLAGMTERKQGLHDLVAGTCVVFRDVEPGQPVTRPRPPMPWYGWLVHVVLLVVPASIGILAAIAVPAYQDYVTRSKVAAATAGLGALKLEVAEARLSGEACPQQQRAGDDPMIASVVFAGDAPRCSITVTLAESDNVPRDARGQTIEWTYANDERWECLTTLAGKLAPRDCR